nr:hypothetical protein [Tanacetum cinerariifolium]
MPRTPYSTATHFGGVTDWYQSQVMSSDSHAIITYTSMSSYEVIVNGYYGMPMDLLDPYIQIVMEALPSPDYIPGPEAPPSPDYIPGPEAPPSPDYIPGLKYPEYLPPPDNVLPAEEQPLPAAVSPTVESLGYITESELEMEPEEEDGDDEESEEDSIEYPTSGGDDDGDDLSEDDADDEDEEESSDSKEEEEEHLALTVPAPALYSSVSAYEETKPFEEGETAATPPPFRYHVAARISIQPHILMPFRSESESTSGNESIPKADIPLRKRSRFTTPTGGYETEEREEIFSYLVYHLCTGGCSLSRLLYSDHGILPVTRGVAAAMAEAEVSKVRNGYGSNSLGPRLAQAIRVALTWWNYHVKTVTLEVAQALPWKTLKKMMTDKVEKYIGGLPDMIHDSVKETKPKTMQKAIEFATELMDKRIRDAVENKRKFEGTSRNNQNQPQQNKRQNTGRAYAVGNSDRNIYTGSKPLCFKCDYHHE